MTQIHQAKCDKCGKIKNMRPGTFYNYNLPLFWINVDKNFLLDADLCASCKKKFKEHSKGFWK